MGVAPGRLLSSPPILAEATSHLQVIRPRSVAGADLQRRPSGVGSYEEAEIGGDAPLLERSRYGKEA